MLGVFATQGARNTEKCLKVLFSMPGTLIHVALTLILGRFKQIPSPAMPASDNTKEALKEPIHIGGAVLAIALTAISKSPIPLVAGCALDGLYIGFIPKSNWYAERLALRYDKKVLERREKMKIEIGPTLPQGVMARFSRLESMRNQIGSQTFEGKKWFRDVLRKLDYLMEKFLLFASKQVQFQNYLKSVLEETASATVSSNPAGSGAVRPSVRRAEPNGELDDTWISQTVESIQKHYISEIESIEALASKDENPHNDAILDKRKDILNRRRQYVVQIGEILTNLTHQLRLMEDTFGLINDEIRVRSPEQLSADIEDVIFRTDSLTNALQKVSPFEQMAIAPGAEKLYDLGKS